MQTVVCLMDLLWKEFPEADSINGEVLLSLALIETWDLTALSSCLLAPGTRTSTKETLMFKAFAMIICAIHRGGSGVFELYVFHSDRCLAGMRAAVKTLMLYLTEMDWSCDCCSHFPTPFRKDFWFRNVLWKYLDWHTSFFLCCCAFLPFFPLWLLVWEFSFK